MWETWLEYHGNHGGGFRVAHDIGAGPGNAAQELSKHFSHVYVSDPGELNIAAARQMLQPPEKFTCSRQPAEAAWLDDASVDLACICMALHFMDPDAAIYQAAKAMRPGGTLAICTYSFKVRFPRCPRLDSLWLEVVTVAVKLAGEHCIPRAVEGLQRVVTGLDYASLPEHLFHDVTRLRINAGRDEKDAFCFFDDEGFAHAETKVKTHEQVHEVADDGWRREVDTDWLRGFLANSHLGLKDDEYDMPSWKELERTINEELGGHVLVEWPVAMIMASKNGLKPR
ncbi:hypothetical protein G6O67_003475 [Ophiocordyceps sinensis]|uniref:Methyltransferase type 11 domain-containing protein n=2 Tax=Ophiocordyceps sinensis TaxID=72228 RepID=A0A8H4PWF3_9HYPO|nr:Methyltransferase type 11 [Ophiocordyceps sinensis CO18]KAF4511703.1 hypothetical protein G6O67_003475 [Ophiocordyceps sinensis]